MTMTSMNPVDEIVMLKIFVLVLIIDWLDQDDDIAQRDDL